MRLEAKDIEEIVGGDKSFAGGEVFERRKRPFFLLGAAVFLLSMGWAALHRDEKTNGRSDGGSGGEIVFETERRSATAGVRGAADGIADGPIVVDVGGAVERPGVYELEAGARVKDALVASGGLAANADREYVSRSINLAKPVRDGEKVYIPASGEVGDRKRIGETGEPGETGGLININTASASELEKLKGIGRVRAQKVIEGRPYGSVEELKTKGVLGAKTFEKIKDEIAVY